MTLTKLDRLALGVLLACGMTLAAMLLVGRAASAQASGIAYLAPASGPREVWLHPLQGERRPLTDTGGQVFDFAVSPDGAWVSYSAVNEQSGVDLWRIPTGAGLPQLLVDCGRNRCIEPAWSPDGTRIAYSREEITSAGGLGPSRLWTVQVASGQTAALYQDSQVLGHAPSWSPQGDRLAFFDGNLGAIRVLQIDSGIEELLPTRMGVVGGWSPRGDQMLFTVMRFEGESALAGLQLANFSQGDTARVELPELAARDFGVPAWSPGGEWVLVGLQAPASGPGRQLWLMRPDGTEAHPLVSDPGFTHGGYRWSPEGDRIVYQRFPLRVANAVPEIFLFDLETDQFQLLTTDASSPAWVP